MKQTLIITWLVTVALTVGLYLYIFSSSEYGQLFAINLGVALVSLSLLLFSFGGFMSKEGTEVTNASKSTLLIIYAIALFGWTTASSLIWQDDPFLKIWIGNGVLTLVLAVVYGMTAAGSEVIAEHEATVQTVREAKKVTVFSIQDWCSDLINLTAKEEEDWKDELCKNARSIKERIETIPARLLERNPDFLDAVASKSNRIIMLASSLGNAENKGNAKAQLSEEIAALKKYVEREKNKL